MGCNHPEFKDIGLGLDQCTKCGWYKVVGDRFYQQQLAALGDCPGAPLNAKTKKSRASTPRVTKADLLGSLPKGVAKLTKPDVEKVVELWPSRKLVDVPTGRLKKPYADALREAVGEADWMRLTVADMKEVLAEL